LELSDGTYILAEAGAAKERINEKGDKKIIDNQPGRPDRLIPKVEDFITPKEENQKCNSKPF